MKAGESKSFSTTIPEDYTNEKLAGQQADYEITLHKVEEKALPELDDAFAAKVSDEQYETMEDLSKALSDNILETKNRRIRDELRDKIVDAVIDQSQFTIHPLLVEDQAEEMLHQFTHMLENQHLSLEQYLMMMRKSREEYLEELKPDAEKSVKRQLVLDEIARREDITITPDEIEGLFSLYAQAGQELPRTEEQIRAVASSYRREKTLARLTELTTDPDPESEESVSEQSELPEHADEATVENAKAAALTSEASSVEAHNEDEASATATPLSGESNAETVE